MPIPFQCPHCGHRTDVEDHFAGMTGPCAVCGRPIAVPRIEYVAPNGRRPSSGAGATIWIVLGCFAFTLLLCGGLFVMWAGVRVPSAIEAPRAAAQRMACTNNLKQIGVALHNYHDVYNTLPRAEGEDREGPPYRSWRVAILPYIGEQELYERFDMDEPWNSEHNLEVAASTPMPDVFQCPGDENIHVMEVNGHLIPTTNYVMVTGPDSMGDGVSFKDAPDGPSQTIMVVEVSGGDRPAWTAPEDIPLDDLRFGIRSKSQPSIVPNGKQVGGAHPEGANVLLADGRVELWPAYVSVETLQQTANRHDGASGSYGYAH